MDYLVHLTKDRRMRKLIERSGPLKVTRRKNVFLFLCRSVISQQLSTKVARIIEQRFLELLVDGTGPEAVLKVDASKLRAIGFSATKAAYVHNIAQYFSDLALTDKSFSKLDDESVIELLTPIKGVGRWTAEMTLMFSLGREDVFAVDDYGIQQSMAEVYQLDGADKRVLKERMLTISRRWSPYRTYACLHLWKARDLSA
jgi:DNA-3-methyladenine glycosylase II